MGVRVDDKEKTWQAGGAVPGGGGGGGSYGGGGGFGGGGGGSYGGGSGYGGAGSYGGGGGSGYGHDFQRDPSDQAPIDANRVNQLLTQRNDAKRQRDFNLADQIRDQLKNTMGVEVYDKDKLWRVGGRPGMGGSMGGGGGGFGGGGIAPYRRDDDGSVPCPDIERVTALLAQRQQAKLNRDFQTADVIRDQLKSLNVEIDDPSRTWKMRGAGPGGGGGGGGGGGFSQQSYSGYSVPPGYGAPPPPSYHAPPPRHELDRGPPPPRYDDRGPPPPRYDDRGGYGRGPPPGGGGRGREDDFGDFSSMRRDRDDRGGGGRERDRYDDRPPRRSGFS